MLYVLPGSDYGGCQENIVDTWVDIRRLFSIQVIRIFTCLSISAFFPLFQAMLSSSRPLQIVILCYLLSCSVYNWCGMSITRYLNAVHRTMLDAWRTMVIWGFGLFYHYGVDSSSSFGEVWTRYSFLQLIGRGGLEPIQLFAADWQGRNVIYRIRSSYEN